MLPVIPELGRQRQEDYCKLKGNIVGIYTERTCQGEEEIEGRKPVPCEAAGSIAYCVIKMSCVCVFSSSGFCWGLLSGKILLLFLFFETGLLSVIALAVREIAL